MNKIVIILLLCLATQAQAEITTYTFKKYFQDSTYYYQEGPYLKPIKDALAWDVFATTTEKDSRPVFGEIKNHEKKEITLYGYMFTMFQKYPLKHFILGPYPNTCPFHYHVRKNLIVEVIPEQAMTYSDSPVLLKGTLKLVTDDSEDTYYLLKHAVLVK